MKPLRTVGFLVAGTALAVLLVAGAAVEASKRKKS